jgi:uncharacterized oxidoreductase
LPAYVKHAREGLVTLDSEPEITTDSGSILRIDAKGGWGRPSGDFAMARGIERAQETGSGEVRVARRALIEHRIRGATGWSSASDRRDS